MELQLVELLFRTAPQPDYRRITARTQELLGGDLHTPDPDGVDKAFLIFHLSHPIKYTDAEVPSQTALLASDQPVLLEGYAEDIQQSWSCPHAGELISGARHSLLVTEMMTRLLSPQDRVRLFHGVLQAAIEATSPAALVFKHSQQVVDPKEYLEACSNTPIVRPGSLNVRFFNISNSPGDMIMDTRGLHETGLHDLQCHFRDLEPNAVSRVLYNTAVYIFENGANIESGHTVAGIEPASRWRCQFENSLLPPERELLDLNPGPSHAAGNR
jgi:hypothetical protein